MSAVRPRVHAGAEQDALQEERGRRHTARSRPPWSPFAPLLVHPFADDPACRRGDGKTRQLSVLGRNCLDPLCRGTMHPVYTDKQLYTQLTYFVHLFDVPHALDQVWGWGTGSRSGWKGAAGAMF